MIYRYELGDYKHLNEHIDTLYKRLKETDVCHMVNSQIVNKEKDSSSGTDIIGLIDTFNLFSNNLDPNVHRGLVFKGDYNGEPIKIGVNLDEWVVFISSDADEKAIKRIEKTIELQPCTDYEISDESFYRLVTEEDM